MLNEYTKQNRLLMETPFKKVDSTFNEFIEDIIGKKKYVRIQYFTPIREFLTTTSIIKEIFSKENETYIRLASGEEIRMDRIARIEDTPAPGYSTDYFTCDC